LAIALATAYHILTPLLGTAAAGAFLIALRASGWSERCDVVLVNTLPTLPTNAPRAHNPPV
jgi:hypothetical protein